MRRWLAGLAVLAGLLVCSAPAPALASSGFVEADGAAFSLNGLPWRPIGYNQYRLTSMPGGYLCDPGYGAITDASLDQRLDDMKAAGANVVRTWFFQSYYDGGGWAPFDRVLNAAAARGMLVIPVLVNQFTDCEPPSIEKNYGFYQSAFRSPGYGYSMSYEDYARMVAAHYADNTTVAFWQLVNEAEPQYDGCPSDAGSVLAAFAAQMRAQLRSVDPNHLVSLGTIGADQCGTLGSDYETVMQAVDICEVHDYGSPQLALPGDATNGIAERIAQCNALGKPIFVGEAGIPADVGPDGQSTGTIDETTLDQRAAFFSAKIAAQFALGMDGYLIWEKILENSDSAYNQSSGLFGVGAFGVGTTEDPVAQVMRDAAAVSGPPPPPPPSATTGAASGITASTATLNGSVTPNGSDAKFVFEYGTSTSFGAISAIGDAGSGSTPVPATGSVTGLAAGTTYLYRLVATSAQGTSFGSVASFTTGGSPTPPVAVTLAPVSTGDTAAVVAGSVNPDGQATAFTFEYGTTTSFGSITPVVELDSARSPEPVTASMSGLAPDTTYLYRVVATNASGTTHGEVMSLTTGPGGRPVVSTRPASAITATGAVLNGTVDPQSSAASFTFEYGTTTAFGSITAVDSAGSAPGAQAVSLPTGGLSPNTTYVYRIDATNANGTVAGAVEAFTTGES